MCTSKWNVENPKIELHFIALYFWFYKKFTQQYEYENHYRSLYFSCLLKTSIEIQQKITCFVETKSK
jgi:hypothetical protein